MSRWSYKYTGWWMHMTQNWFTCIFRLFINKNVYLVVVVFFFFVQMQFILSEIDGYWVILLKKNDAQHQKTIFNPTLFLSADFGYLKPLPMSLFSLDMGYDVRPITTQRAVKSCLGDKTPARAAARASESHGCGSERHQVRIKCASGSHVTARG